MTYIVLCWIKFELNGYFINRSNQLGGGGDPSNCNFCYVWGYLISYLIINDELYYGNMSYANLFGHSAYDEIIQLKGEIAELEHEITIRKDTIEVTRAAQVNYRKQEISKCEDDLKFISKNLKIDSWLKHAEMKEVQLKNLKTERRNYRKELQGEIDAEQKLLDAAMKSCILKRNRLRELEENQTHFTPNVYFSDSDYDFEESACIQNPWFPERSIISTACTNRYCVVLT